LPRRASIIWSMKASSSSRVMLPIVDRVIRLVFSELCLFNDYSINFLTRPNAWNRIRCRSWLTPARSPRLPPAHRMRWRCGCLRCPAP
jgi:hypothetical protein